MSRTARSWTKRCVLLVVLPLIFSCNGGSGDGGNGVPPTFEVSTTTPPDGAADVPPDSNFTVTWNQNVDCATVSARTVTATSPEWELFSCSEGHAIFYPVGQDYESSYQVTISDNIRSSSGTAPASSETVSYTTTAPPPSWGGTLLEGGSGNDSVADGAVDSAGNIYLIGSTSSDLFEPNQGNRDVFVASYDAGGALRWDVQFGDAGDDRGLGIAIANGGVYIVGDTNDGNFGLPLTDDSLGGIDAFVARLDPVEGNTEWMRRFGTIQTDSARDVAVDSSGDIYVAGMTSGTLAGTGAQGDEDAFLARFSDAESIDGSSGSRRWVNQFGLDATSEDAAAVAVTDGFVYIAGKTGAVDTQGDAYVSRHSLSDGNRLTQWRLGNEGVDYANSLAVDTENNLYIAGRTETDIDNDGINVQGLSDAFLAKIDPSTVQGVQWAEVLASPAEDEAFGVAVDDFGNLYVTGEANADLAGEINNHQGGGDLFTGRFTTDGDRNWLNFLGTSADETGFEVFPGGRGTVFVTGATNGDLDNGQNAGGSDGFLARYTSAGVLE